MADKQLASYGGNARNILAIVMAGIIIVAIGSIYSLGVVTIDPGNIGIVYQKWGSTDPDGHFIVESGYKGTHREVLTPGRYIFWSTKLIKTVTEVPMTEIPEGRVGVLIAQDGRELKEGAVLAEDDEFDANGMFQRMGEKGIRKTILKPGKYPINTDYFNVKLFDALTIEPGKVGVLTRRIGDPAPTGQILVDMDSNYRGYIREVLEPGLRYLHPEIYSWEIVDALNIPAGKVGVLTRKIGDPAPAGQRLVPRESNYRGIIREVLEPGTRYLHPKMYSWDIVDAISIPAGKVGILTRKIGAVPPPGTILVDRNSDYQGIVKEVIEPGLYYLNPYEFEVQMTDAINIPDGFVGVMIAKIGKPASEERLLVEEGYRGVRKQYLKPGLYYLNSYEVDVVPVDTRKQKYEMTSRQDMGDTSFADGITFLSNDGFEISIDVTILYEIQPENAPYVVATVGKNLEDVKTIIIRPGSRSFARLEGSMLKAVEFVKGETRKSFQEKLAHAVKAEGIKAKVNILNTFVRSYTIPENLLEPIRMKEIAEKQREQYVEEQKREEEQAKLATQKALVQQQSQKINAETGKIVAETKAEEQKRVAIIKGEQMLEVAKLDRQAAEQEKLKQIALGEGEAKRRKLLIDADNLEELRLNIYKEVMTRFASEIGKQKWVPDMVIGGGQAGGNGGVTNAISDVLNMLTVMVANQLRVQTGSSQPETPAVEEQP